MYCLQSPRIEGEDWPSGVDICCSSPYLQIPPPPPCEGVAPKLFDPRGARATRAWSLSYLHTPFTTLPPPPPSVDADDLLPPLPPRLDNPDNPSSAGILFECPRLGPREPQVPLMILMVLAEDVDATVASHALPSLMEPSSIDRKDPSLQRGGGACPGWRGRMPSYFSPSSLLLAASSSPHI